MLSIPRTSDMKCKISRFYPSRKFSISRFHDRFHNHRREIKNYIRDKEIKSSDMKLAMGGHCIYVERSIKKCASYDSNRRLCAMPYILRRD